MIAHRRLALALLPVVAVAGVGLFVASSSASTPAVATSFSVTVAGTAMHALDERVAPQLVPNSGGGVTPTWESGAQPATTKVYLEAGVDLPLNAKVTSVSYTVTPG